MYTHTQTGRGGGGWYPQLASGSDQGPTSVRSSWIFLCKRVGYANSTMCDEMPVGSYHNDKVHSKKLQMSIKRLTNISDVRLLSACCPFAVRCIGRRLFLCTICALEHLCTNHQPNICAQTVDGYFGRPFAVRLCTND